MGVWQREYERHWQRYTAAVLENHFGRDHNLHAQQITAEDRQYLTKVLQSLGAYDNESTQVVDSDDRTYDTENELMHDSYIYRTPEGKKSRDSIAMTSPDFPAFQLQDIASEDQTQLEMASQRLQQRMADVSPIVGRLGSVDTSNAMESAGGQRESQRSDTRESMVLFAITSNLVNPINQMHAASRKSLTPQPVIRQQIDTHDASMYGLDVSMQSMHLSEGDVSMHDIIDIDDDVGKEEEEEEEEEENALLSITKVREELLTVDDERTLVHKALLFTSDTEDDNIEEEVKERSLDEQPNAHFDDEILVADRSVSLHAGEDIQEAQQDEEKVTEESQAEFKFGHDDREEKEPEDSKEIEPNNNSKQQHGYHRRFCNNNHSVEQDREEEKPVDQLFQTKLPLELEYHHRSSGRQRLRRRRKSHTVKPGFPYRLPNFRVELQPYQRDAVAWMLAREQGLKHIQTNHNRLSSSSKYLDKIASRVRGGILADEMGLGKTVCCMALICESLAKTREEMHQSESSRSAIARLKPPTLIVTPLSILGQWESEIRRKSNMSVIVYQGHTRKSFRTAMEFMGADIVLSTYDTLRLKECKVSSLEDDTSDENDESVGLNADVNSNGNTTPWRSAIRTTKHKKKRVITSKLHQLTWHRIILDESHLITNPTCARALAAFSLKSKRRWCVTGTPIQNSTKDLSSLVQFLGVPQTTEAELNDILPLLMLRRLKSSVNSSTNEPILTLPDKIEQVIELTFSSDVEKAFYILLHRSTKRQVMQYLQAADTHPHFMHVFELLLRLRQTCDSFALVTRDPFAEVQGNATLLAETGSLSHEDAALIQRVQRSEQNADIVHENGGMICQSTKITALLAELTAVKQRKEKALVLSQWTSFLDLIDDSLSLHNSSCNSISSTSNISYSKLDGRMTSKEREQVIASFQHDKRLDVLLISLRTGGLGLNLTEASHVFIMEPSWNPSLESQAIDRAHRFGQQRQVRVVRFLMKNTIEERVVELQKAKKQLAAAFLGDPTENSGREMRLSKNELRGLFMTQQ